MMISEDTDIVREEVAAIELVIFDDPFDKRQFSRYMTDDVGAALRAHFKSERLPDFCRIFHEEPALTHEITPLQSKADVDNLLSLKGRIIVMVMPESPLQVAQIVILVALSVVSMILAPKVTPSVPPTQRQIQASSPNNDLSARTNQARINGRIPDIFGQVRATPDLIAVPYSVFENHIEKEIAFLCIGRGTHDTDEEKDDDTLLSEIAGASCAVYAPNTSPNSGDSPQKQIGSAITDPLLSVVKVSAINGQVLQPRNARRIEGDSNIRFVYPDKIQLLSDTVRFDDRFQPGNPLAVINGADSGLDLSGNYTIVSVGSYEIGLSNPAAINSDWNSLNGLGAENATNYISATLTAGVDIGASGGVGDGMRYVYPGSIETNNSAIDFAALLEYGDLVSTRAGATVSVPSFSATYSVVSSTASECVVDTSANPTAWAYLAGLVGQTYSPPGTGTNLAGDSDGNGSYETTLTNKEIRFVYPNKIQRVNTDFSFSALIGSGAGIQVTRDQYDISLDHDYEIDYENTTDSVLALQDAVTAQPNWNELQRIGGTSPYQGVYLAAQRSAWVGPYTIDKDDLTRVMANFVATNGLYRDDGTTAYPIDVECEAELAPVDDNGDEILDASGNTQREYFQETVIGSSVSRTTRAVSLVAEPTGFTGRCSVRVRRVSLAYTGSGQIVEEVKVRDIYGASPLDQHDFGDVTTVHLMTYATAGALAVKERKFNCLATRKLPAFDSETEEFSETLYATQSADDIMAAVALDPYIGNRSQSEIDLTGAGTGIYPVVADVKAYFGLEKAGQFNYTFDKTDMSAEEHFAAIAEAVFCTAYRRGPKLQLFFERETADSALLFNHRNKNFLGSGQSVEQRTFSFGYGGERGYDGVKYKFVNPDDGSDDSYDIPEDQSATNPQVVESIGVRSAEQAYLHAYRIWNKLLHQHEIVEFEGLEESELLRRTERILCADDTDPNKMRQAGEVLSQSILTLELSQPATLEDGTDYVIQLQLPDGTVEAIGITPGTPDSDGTYREVVLDTTPSVPLSLDPSSAVRCAYVIVEESDDNATALLVLERDTSQSGKPGGRVKAINYDDRYYENDLDLSYNTVITALGADLLAMWDTQALDTITKDTDGTVSSWRDIIGGYEAKQSVLGRRPIWTSKGFGGRAGIESDASDDRLLLGVPSFPSGAAQVEIWLVVDQQALIADATDRMAFGYGGLLNIKSINVGRTVSGGVNRALLWVGNGVSYDVLAGSNVDLSGRHVIRAQIGATTSYLSVDGVSEGSVSSVPSINNTGARMFKNAIVGGTTLWNGQLACVVVTNPLSTDKATALQTYLNQRRRA